MHGWTDAGRNGNLVGETLSSNSPLHRGPFLSNSKTRQWKAEVDSWQTPRATTLSCWVKLSTGQNCGRNTDDIWLSTGKKWGRVVLKEKPLSGRKMLSGPEKKYNGALENIHNSKNDNNCNNKCNFLKRCRRKSTHKKEALILILFLQIYTVSPKFKKLFFFF